MRRRVHTLVEQSIRDLIQRYFSPYTISRSQMIEAMNHPTKYSQLIIEYQGKQVDFMQLPREKQIVVIKSSPK